MAEVVSIPVKRLKWVHRPKERKKLPKSYYLLPSERKFPYKNKDGSINLKLLRAAMSRARQYGYEAVYQKAKRIYERYKNKRR